MTSLNELRELIARHCDGGFIRTRIPRMTLMRSEHTTAASESVYEAWLLVVAQGRVRMVLGEDPFELSADRYAVTSVGNPPAKQTLQK